MRIGEAQALLKSARTEPSSAGESLKQVRDALPTLPPSERAKVESDLMELESTLSSAPKKLGAEGVPTKAQALETARAGKAFELGDGELDLNKQLAAEGRALRTAVFTNPSLAKQINSLEDKSIMWDQIRPNIVEGAVISSNPVGRAVLNAVNNFAEHRHDAAEAKLKPLVQQFMSEVREGTAKNGGDPGRVNAHDTLYSLEQLMIDLPGLRAAAAKQGVNLDALPPQDASKLLESSTMRFDDKNNKVYAFPDDVIAKYRT